MSREYDDRDTWAIVSQMEDTIEEMEKKVDKILEYLEDMNQQNE